MSEEKEDPILAAPNPVKDESIPMETNENEKQSTNTDSISDEKEKITLSYDERRLSLLSNPTYGVILAFLEKFRSNIDIQDYPWHLLEENLLNDQESVSRRLVDFHLTLLKRISLGKGAQRDKFNAIITKNLLESQFDHNQAFRTALGEKPSFEVRSQPFGRDRSGAFYWLFMDAECFVRLFREDVDDDRTWTSIATDKDQLENFIKLLITDHVVRKKFPEWKFAHEPFNSLESSNDFQDRYVPAPVIVKEEDVKPPTPPPVSPAAPRIKTEKNVRGKSKKTVSPAPVVKNEVHSDQESSNSDDKTDRRLPDESIEDTSANVVSQEINNNQEDEELKSPSKKVRSRRKSATWSKKKRRTISHTPKKEQQQSEVLPNKSPIKGRKRKEIIMDEDDVQVAKKNDETSQDKDTIPILMDDDSNCNDLPIALRRSRRVRKPPTNELSAITSSPAKSTSQTPSKKKLTNGRGKNSSQTPVKVFSQSVKSKSKKRGKGRRRRGKKSSANGASSSSEEEQQASEEEEDEYNSDDYLPTSKQLDELDDENLLEEEDNDDDDEFVPRRSAKTVAKRRGQMNENNTEDLQSGSSACCVCAKTDRPEALLLCDDCDDPYHLECLKPILLAVPEGDWYCPLCEHKRFSDKLVERFIQLIKDYEELEVKRKQCMSKRTNRLANVMLNLDRMVKRSSKKRRTNGIVYSDEENEDEEEENNDEDNKSEEEQEEEEEEEENNDDDDDDSVYGFKDDGGFDRRAKRKQSSASSRGRKDRYRVEESEKLGVRSCRRKPQNYRFDDYDKKMKEAILQPGANEEDLDKDFDESDEDDEKTTSRQHHGHEQDEDFETTDPKNDDEFAPEENNSDGSDSEEEDDYNDADETSDDDNWRSKRRSSTRKKPTIKSNRRKSRNKSDDDDDDSLSESELSRFQTAKTTTDYDLNESGNDDRRRSSRTTTQKSYTKQQDDSNDDEDMEDLYENGQPPPRRMRYKKRRGSDESFIDDDDDYEKLQRKRKIVKYGKVASRSSINDHLKNFVDDGEEEEEEEHEEEGKQSASASQDGVKDDTNDESKSATKPPQKEYNEQQPSDDDDFPDEQEILKANGFLKLQKTLTAPKPPGFRPPFGAPTHSYQHAIVDPTARFAMIRPPVRPTMNNGYPFNGHDPNLGGVLPQPSEINGHNDNAETIMNYQRIFLVFILFIIHCHGVKDKFVSITLDAKWLDTPLHQEASEFLATQNKQYFWSLINDVSSFDSFTPDALGSAKNYHDQLLSFSSRYLNTITNNLLRMALALRSYSPGVQMMRRMAHDTGMTRQCSTFVDIHGIYTCNVEEVETLVESVGDRSKFLLPFDHHFPGKSDDENKPVATVVLYGDFGNQNEFRSFHSKLSSLALNGKIDYVLRHNSQSSNENRRKVRLAGYGVELQIKSTEYKATDDSKIRDDQTNVTAANEEKQEEAIHGFIFSKLKELHPEKQTELNEFRTYLLDGSDPMTPLKAWQMQDLSLQCAFRALSEKTPEAAFNTLVELSQNFPSRARLLSKVKIDSSFRDAHRSNQDEFRNQMELEAGHSSLFINSIPQSLDTIDLYVLLNTLLNEGQMMERLHMIGLNKTHTRQLLTNELNIQAINYILDFRHPAIFWLNDLEKDSQYSKWPSSYYDLLRNNFFGGLRTIRKNLYNLVLVIDPSDIDTSYELMKNIEAYFVHELPIRIGVVFITSDEYSIQLYRAFRYLLKQHGNPARALSFVNELYKSKNTDVKQVFSKKAKYSGSLTSIFDDPNPFETERLEMNAYFEQSGLSRGNPHVLFNGNPLTADELLPTAFEDVITTRMLRMQFDIQQQVYHGQLRDSDNIIELLNTKPNVVKRLNQRIFGQTGSMPTVYIDLSMTDGQAKDVFDAEKFRTLSVREQAAVIMSSMIYLGKKDELGQPLYPITLWIACDLDRPEGRQLFLNALLYLKSHTHARLGLLASFDSESNLGSHPITKAVYTATKLLSPPIARTFITKLLKDESVIEDLLAKRKSWSDVTVSGLSGETLEQELATFDDNIFRSHSIFIEQGLNLPRGSRAVLVNGRILGPLHNNEQFTEDDFILLDKHLSTTINDRLVRMVNKLQLSNDPSELSNLLMRISSIVSQNDKSSTPVTRKQTPRISTTSKAVLHLPAAHADEPAFLVEAIIDPASRDGQRLLALLSALRQSVNIDLTIYFNCKLQLSEMPLKSFYRYVYDINLQQMPSALFQYVPETPILTLGMVTPESWMVEAVTSPYDLDNIHLKNVPVGVSANFELQYLLIEGQCFDETQSYPRGLQLILGTNRTKNMFDTIVMANLGYFQLKAFPGVWHLNLREGRSDDIYTIASHDNTDSSTRTSQPVIVAIRSFDARWIKVYVARKPGKENDKLLEDDGSEDASAGGGSIWDSFSFGGSPSGSVGTKIDEVSDDTINIFSVASGHLYERLLRIMMLSVLKNTKKPVKFWFLKNFLSPIFTSFLPYYAQHYNFTYELVQYKWPKWLTVYPTEKQRVIWGYKILFLDVLFPLDLKKVIFVDADQVVRADMAELRDLDLHGAPYGYVPFCENRREMDGYRFWKSGYWASHLGHRRYHISALYVIDLKKFRKIAAGDRLRGQYYGLSQDPNSLSNLDQDLPNNMIHQVNIYSLPEEWLWCETWCNDESKKRAKTIDLCNNPQTKESKLTAATRIISEWTDYDQEIKNLINQWEEAGKPKVTLTSTATTDAKIVDHGDSIHTHDPTDL
ncbi:unnamed protein product [Adineta ricciae]|uniref:PHD-type domain-containing protein n=1 Tax=Adineta ricciae TaxID=249248 RepID=A0A814MMB0_ADIRI|nr:unnamed protein product [Adineta ricciae]